jgi:heptosyltransferase III
MVRTIIMVHPGGLGDLLLAVPAMRRLRVRYPHHRLVLWAQAEPSAFLQACGLVDEWTALQHMNCTALFGGFQPEHPALKDWLGRCDFAVAWTKDEEGLLVAALTNGGAASVVVQSPFSSALKSVHQSDRFLESLREPADDPAAMCRLAVPPDIREQAESHLRSDGASFDRPVALIHPGSGSRHKCVQPAVLRSVADGLDEQGFQPWLLEGPADRAMLADLLPHRPRTPMLLQNLTVSLLAGVLSRVELFVGHDSGVSHLAALLGVPTVALFGPTDPRRWAPRGPAVTVLQAKPCRCDSWDSVSRCEEKPCLDFLPADILAACRTTRSVI